MSNKYNPAVIEGQAVLINVLRSSPDNLSIVYVSTELLNQRPELWKAKHYGLTDSKGGFPYVLRGEGYIGHHILEEGKDFSTEKLATFVPGNYSNMCGICGRQFYHTDKLWFVCQDCCNKDMALPMPANDKSGNEGERIGIDEPIYLTPNEEELHIIPDGVSVMKLDRSKDIKEQVKEGFYKWFHTKYSQDSNIPDEVFDWIYDHAVTWNAWEIKK